MGRKEADKFTKILSNVLAKVKPGRNELEDEETVLNEVCEKLKSAVPSEVEVVLVGSVAKGTQLKSKKEFDVFLLFPQYYSKKDLEKYGVSSAKKAFRNSKCHLAYAEHPYLSVMYKDYDIDVVPAYRIASIEERGTAVDRSPLHTAYVNGHLAEKEKDNVRMLKQFMKGQGVYGAEIRVEGFSGYLCELLVIHYGSFLDVLRAASKWSIPTIIDIEGYYDKHANLAKVFDASLIVIDPTDKKRNVAAVVSSTSMSIFSLASRMFLEKPSEEYFFKKKKPVSKKQLAKIINDRKTKILAVEFNAPQGIVEDTLWPQLRRLARSMKAHFKERGFEKFGYYYWSDMKKCMLMFEFSIGELPSVKKVLGPEVSMEKPVELFMKKHRDALDLHVEHERIVAVEPRNITSAEQALQEFTTHPTHRRAIPKSFARHVKKYKMLRAHDLVSDRYFDAAVEYFTRTIEMK